MCLTYIQMIFAVKNRGDISVEAFYRFYRGRRDSPNKRVVISSSTKRNYSYNEATVRTRKTTVRLGRCL